MTSQSLTINTNDLIYWFNAIRNLPDDQRTRALDATWAGQLQSKAWLVNTLKQYMDKPSNVYIFGGWIGILASMMFQHLPVNKIRSIDLDPWCEKVADTINKPYEMDKWRFKAITEDMSSYDYDWGITSDVVVNTSSEHVEQTTYDKWFSMICPGSLVVVQSNNFFDCSEHIRCSHNLNDFENMNNVYNPLFSGQFHTDQYTRYMSIWRK
jgi:spermidine synthase